MRFLLDVASGDAHAKIDTSETKISGKTLYYAAYKLYASLTPYSRANSNHFLLTISLT